MNKCRRPPWECDPRTHDYTELFCLSMNICTVYQTLMVSLLCMIFSFDLRPVPEASFYESVLFVCQSGTVHCRGFIRRTCIVVAWCMRGAGRESTVSPGRLGSVIIRSAEECSMISLSARVERRSVKKQHNLDQCQEEESREIPGKERGKSDVLNDDSFSETTGNKFSICLLCYQLLETRVFQNVHK